MNWETKLSRGALVPLLFTVAFLPATAHAQEAAFTPGIETGVVNPNPALHVGRFDFHGGATATAAYDDLVGYDEHDKRLSDLTWVLSPWGSVQTEGPNGRMVRAYYQPSFLFFTENPDLNTINHSGAFSLVWPFNRLTLSLKEDVIVMSYVVRDVASRTTYSAYTTTAGASYELSDLTSLAATVSYQPTDYGSQYLSYDSFNEQVTLNYQFTPKLNGGVGMQANQLEVKNAPTQTSYGPLLRMGYHPTPRLGLEASVGLMVQQFGSGVPDALAETFSISGSYQVRPTTQLGLQAHRAEVPSGLLVGQNYTDTGFGASLRQTLLRDMVGTLELGYTSADYYATQAGISSGRTDNYYYVRSNLLFPISPHWSVNVFYEHDGNTSSESNFGYDRNTAGVRGSWSF